MSTRIFLSGAILAVGLLLLGYAAPASAQYCEGTVHGLSGRYNLATGAGFLAVRARPSAKARMVGQMFNGNTAEILDKSGSWYRIEIGGISGWVNRKWMRNDCGF